MGLAASQGRYLSLTARMSDLVYEGQQISQQRMALAKESSAVEVIPYMESADFKDYTCCIDINI